jgi:hypothetical protein
MVKINSEHQNGDMEISGRRVERSMEKLQKAYEEQKVRNMGSLNKETVPNGDPPSMMLWGDE